MFDAREYERGCIKKQLEIIGKMNADPKFMSKDVYNLTMMMLDIKPYSKAWRYGYVGSLRRAISALQKQ